MNTKEKNLHAFFNTLAACEKGSPKIQAAWKKLTEFQRSFIFTAKANGFGTLKTVEQYKAAVLTWSKGLSSEIIETPKL